MGDVHPKQSKSVQAINPFQTIPTGASKAFGRHDDQPIADLTDLPAGSA